MSRLLQKKKERKDYIIELQNRMIIGTHSTTVRVITAHISAWMKGNQAPDLW
jgi:hypothetical protein